MAKKYVDLVNGNDTTGNGSAGAPYLTINKAVSVDNTDIRIAKTTSASTISGANFTWTEGSTNVATSADVRASIAVGDYIGKNSAAGNGAKETYYRVTAISASTITIESKYGGTTATETNCKKIAPVVTGAVSAHAATLTAGTVLSGGWNLTNETQDGETWFTKNGARTANYNVIFGNTNNSISNLNCVDGYYGIQVSNTSTFLNVTCCAYQIAFLAATGTSTDCIGQATVTSYGAFYASNVAHTYTRCYALGYNGFQNFQGATFNDCEVLSAIGNGFRANDSTRCFFTNCKAKYCDVGISGFVATIINPTVKYCNSGIKHDPNYSGYLLFGGSVTNCTNGVYVEYPGQDMIINTVITDNTYNIYHASYANLYCVGVDLSRPGTFGVYRQTNSGTSRLKNCVIDNGSVAKAYNVIATGYGAIEVILDNSFGQNGIIKGITSILRDIVKYPAGTTASIAITNTQPITGVTVPETIMSCAVNAALTRTFGFKISSSNASWSGSITVRWRLNGVVIKTESTPITSMSSGSNWDTKSYTCDSSLITSDGILELELVPTMNTYAINVGAQIIS